MSMVAAAVIGSAALGYYASQKSSEAQQEGIESGVQAQKEISDQNIAFQKEMADAQREDFQPWREAGEQALIQLQKNVDSGVYEVGDSDVTKDPGYQFRMDQGIEARDKSAAARGRLQSGAQQKGIENYAQNLASQEYANAYARESNDKARKFNVLSQLSQGGQASAAGQAQTTGQLAQTTGNLMNTQGQNAMNAAYQTGAIRGGAYTDTANIGNQAAQNWLTYKAIG